MSLVRLSPGPAQTHGPLSIITTLPNSRIVFNGAAKEIIPVEKQVILLNSAPKAGQIWVVQGGYFSFARAFTETFGPAPFAPLEYVFEITLMFGSRVIAKQIFETTSSNKDAEEHKWALTGNLESFSDTTVYPGENVTVNTRLTFSNYNEEKNSLGEDGDGEAETKKGEFVFTYTQRSIH